MGSDLKHRGSSTGTIYGFLKDLVILMERFPYAVPAFCFDSKASLREREVYPDYKHSRMDRIREMTPEQKEIEVAYRTQVALLRNEILPAIGFNNIWYQIGYEADDIIGSACGNIRSEITMIVSNDRDMFQLLERGRVEIWNPIHNEILDEEWFTDEFGLRPSDWIKVKAIAGCATDDVPGVGGVGEPTAIKYLRKELKKTTKAYQRIRSEAGQEIIHRNKLLVRLPYPGTMIPELVPDEITMRKWNNAMLQFGIHSLVDLMPKIRKVSQ